jgi:hypothetical protein
VDSHGSQAVEGAESGLKPLFLRGFFSLFFFGKTVLRLVASIKETRI